MEKPVVILDPHWRRMDELFAPPVRAEMETHFDLVWAEDTPIPEALFEAAIGRAEVWIAAEPHADAALLARAPALKAIIEVSGSFPASIDYATCAERGIEVLCCAPGFQRSVAEMALAMVLAGGRGLISEHERFRDGQERWLSDNEGSDFTLYGTDVGFVGFGSIARETARLMAPFRPRLRAYDPWLPEAIAHEYGLELVSLEDLAAKSKCLLVLAIPTSENRGLINKSVMDRMPDGSLLAVISRAHLVDFDDLLALAESGRVRVATDVFPVEPLAADHPIRSAPNVILSPHRAAAVPGGRHQIGELILADLQRIFAGETPEGLQRAAKARLDAVTSVRNAAEVADMAGER